MREERYIGMVAMDGTISAFIVTRNGSDVPVNADSSPTIRIYGSALVTTGTLSTYKDTGSITGATVANPIVITSSGHGLTNGTRVTITGVGGQTLANTTATVANKTSNTFELSGVDGSLGGAYSGSGTWNVTGVYAVSITPTLAAGFSAGSNYSLLVTYIVSSTTYYSVLSFTVV